MAKKTSRTPLANGQLELDLKPGAGRPAGRLPEGWRWVTIGEIVSFEYGKGLVQTKRDSSGKIPVFGSNGIVGYHSDPLVDQPCLIVGRKGTAGAVHISESPCWPIDTTYFVIPPGNVNLHFLYYTFQHLNLVSLNRSTAVPGLNRNDAYALSIPLPPLSEQERIVARIEELFTQLDAGVEALKRVQAGLKRYKAAVLKAAVEGNLTNPSPGTGPRAKAENGLPDGWRWVTVGEIAETIGGVTKGRDFIGKQTIELPYLRVANVQRGQLVLHEMKIIKILHSEIEKYTLHEGDVVLTEGGDWDKLGRSAIWKGQIPKCIHQNHIFRARVKAHTILPEWLMHYTNSEQGQEYFKKAAKQTTNLASINLTQLRTCPIPLPPLSDQIKIVSEIASRLSVAEGAEMICESNLQRAARLRQSILKAAFEGRLT